MLLQTNFLCDAESFHIDFNEAFCAVRKYDKIKLTRGDSMTWEADFDKILRNSCQIIKENICIILNCWYGGYCKYRVHVFPSRFALVSLTRAILWFSAIATILRPVRSNQPEIRFQTSQNHHQVLLIPLYIGKKNQLPLPPSTIHNPPSEATHQPKTNLPITLAKARFECQQQQSSAQFANHFSTKEKQKKTTPNRSNNRAKITAHLGTDR